MKAWRISRRGRTVCCAPGPIRSRAEPARSSATFLPSGCSSSRGCAEGKRVRSALDDEQRAIKQGVHDLCAARYDAAAANRRESSRPDEFWPELSASGWTQLSVPERWGGQGAGLVELSLVIEELGYSLVPATFFGNAAAGLLVAASERDELRDRWLPGIASGEHRAAFGQVQRDGRGLALDAEGAAIAVLAVGGDAVVLDPVPTGLEVADGIDGTRRMHRVAVEP